MELLSARETLIMDSMDWYNLPQYYDFIFDTETQRDADFLEGVIEKYLDGKVERIFEPACGSGRLIRELAKRGHMLKGFDSNRSMLNFAVNSTRRYSDKVSLTLANMDTFRFERTYDLAYCLINTFRYLSTEDAARGHLRCVGNSLKPGGIYVLGLHLTDYSITRCERERTVRENKHLTVVCNIQSWPPDRKKRLQRFRARMRVETPRRMREYETAWMFRTYGPRQIRSLFDAAQDLECIDTYGFDYELSCPHSMGGGRLDRVFILRRT